jgi:hypothetical protein
MDPSACHQWCHVGAYLCVGELQGINIEAAKLLLLLVPQLVVLHQLAGGGEQGRGMDVVHAAAVLLQQRGKVLPATGM